MAFTQTVAPVEEPVSLTTAKAFLRIEHAEDDPFIASLVVTSRLQIETALDLALIRQSWRWSGDVAPGQLIALRPYPVHAVEAVLRVDSDGSQTPLTTSDYALRTDNRPTALAIKAGDACRVQVDFSAGFGTLPEDVPAPIRQSLLQLIAHWYENREPVVFGQPATRIPSAVSELLAPYREARL